ncbi:MAG: hypothetical protein C5B48_01800 [Candidatus Rokuibacteriota bacterium]|nr:MAG: hypothetical protein C5B48_01800 [Candidatus Rokubacteria bacterium]
MEVFMHAASRSSALFVAALLGTASLAHAGNFCFNPGVTVAGSRSLAVAEKFRKPGKGSCSPVNGFDIAAGELSRRLVSGTACLNSSGDTLLVAYVIHVSLADFPFKNFPKFVSMSLPYPSLVDGTGFVSDDGSGTGGQESTNADANPCIPPVIPIP